jgi:hypothetical protein
VSWKKDSSLKQKKKGEFSHRKLFINFGGQLAVRENGKEGKN